MFFCCRADDYDDKAQPDDADEVFDDIEEDPFDDSTPLESRDRLSAIDEIERQRQKREAERMDAARAAYKASDDGSDRVIVLVSGMPSTPGIASRQEEVRKLFASFAITTREVRIAWCRPRVAASFLSPSSR